MTSSASSVRYPALDSVRGIAAVLVVVYHCWAAADGRERLAAIVSPSFWAPGSMGHVALRGVAAVFEMGRAAVMMFFVLSGFVLAHSLLNARDGWVGFVIKRVLRIYPAFVVAVVMSYVLHVLIGTPHPGHSALMARIDEPELAPVATLALWGTARTLDIDLVAWSLVHEMRISLLFPALFWALRLRRRMTLVLCASLSPVCALMLHSATGRMTYGFVETTFAQTLAVTGYFVVFFAAGASLALAWQPVSRLLRRVFTPYKIMSMALACLVLLKGDHGAEALSTILVDYAHGVASLVIVALVIDSIPLSEALATSTLRWLGRISYSLYLVHIPVIYVLSQTLPHISPLISSGAALIASLLLAQMLATTVEKPFLNLGRRLAGRLATRPVTLS